MYKFLIISSALINLSYGTPTNTCQKLAQSQLASINERMNQMIEALYSSSLLPKLKSTTTSSSSSAETASEEYAQSPTPSYETAYYSPTYSSLPPVLPQIVYVSPSQSTPPPPLVYAPPIPPSPIALPPSPITLPPPISVPSYYSPELTQPPDYTNSIVRYGWPSTYSYEPYSSPHSVPPQTSYPPPALPPPLPAPTAYPPLTSYQKPNPTTNSYPSFPPTYSYPLPNSYPPPTQYAPPTQYLPPPQPQTFSPSMFPYPTTPRSYDTYSYPVEYTTVPSYPSRSCQSTSIPSHYSPPPVAEYPPTPNYVYPPSTQGLTHSYPYRTN